MRISSEFFIALLVVVPLACVAGAPISDQIAHRMWVGSPEEIGDRSFNPYRWIEENIPAATVDELSPEINRGAFDNAATPSEVRAEIAYALHRDALERAQRGHPVAALLGKVLGRMMDPVSWTLAAVLFPVALALVESVRRRRRRIE